MRAVLPDVARTDARVISKVPQANLSERSEPARLCGRTKWPARQKLLSNRPRWPAAVASTMGHIRVVVSVHAWTSRSMAALRSWRDCGCRPGTCHHRRRPTCYQQARARFRIEHFD